MDAFVNGLVIRDENSGLIVKCDNGKLVSVDCDGISFPKLTGRSVEIRGGVYFRNGEMIVYAREVDIIRKKRPYAITYKEEED